MHELLERSAIGNALSTGGDIQPSRRCLIGEHLSLVRASGAGWYSDSGAPSSSGSPSSGWAPAGAAGQTTSAAKAVQNECGS